MKAVRVRCPRDPVAYTGARRASSSSSSSALAVAPSASAGGGRLPRSLRRALSAAMWILLLLYSVCLAAVGGLVGQVVLPEGAVAEAMAWLVGAPAMPMPS